MKACGIVAEYNPFHKGHAYQIERARAQTGAEVIIAVMSGNFLQRGEPAIVDKWTRTQMALSAGVDLIVELPVIWSIQPADYFAEGAIRILNTLNIDYLSFGTEAGTAHDFLKAANFLLQNEKRISEEIKKSTEMNMPYAKKMEEIIFKLNPDFPLDLASPNLQLALSYQKEILKQGMGNKIDVFPIERIGAAYGEENIDNHSEITSATAIRKAVFRGEDISSYLKERSTFFFNQKIAEKVSWENYFLLLKYQLTVKSKSELKEIYQMTEGLENRLKNFIEESNSFEEFINKVKTKRYTRTRLQRLLSYVLLNIKKADVEEAFTSQPSVRILGFNQNGQSYLNQESFDRSVPVISNVNRETKKYLKHDLKSGKIYRLGNEGIKKQDFSRKPIIFD